MVARFKAEELNKQMDKKLDQILKKVDEESQQGLFLFCYIGDHISCYV